MTLETHNNTLQEVPLTPTQKSLARHALGLPNQNNMSFRNRYWAPFQSSQENALSNMASAGFARKCAVNKRLGMCLYMLTHNGALAALNPGEKLAEDF